MVSKRTFGGPGKEKPPDFSKRYWIAGIDAYYPSGFLDDITATCDTKEELKSLIKPKEQYSWQVFWDSLLHQEVDLDLV